MTYYRNDPYWLQAKYPSRCAGCGQTIVRGERIFYYPKGKFVLSRACADAASREFESARADEDFYNL